LRRCTGPLRPMHRPRGKTTIPRRAHPEDHLSPIQSHDTWLAFNRPAQRHRNK
jgi:hypothetical protein